MASREPPPILVPEPRVPGRRRPSIPGAICRASAMLFGGLVAVALVCWPEDYVLPIHGFGSGGPTSARDVWMLAGEELDERYLPQDVERDRSIQVWSRRIRQARGVEQRGALSFLVFAEPSPYERTSGSSPPTR